MKKIPSSTLVTQAILAKAAATERTSARSKQSTPLPATRPVPHPANGSGGNGGSNGELNTQEVLGALVALKKGDFSARLPVGWSGVAGKVADTFNDVAEMMYSSTEQLSRVSRVVGKE